MKKLIMVLVALVLTFSVTACSGRSTTGNTDSSQTTQNSGASSTTSSDIQNPAKNIDKDSIKIGLAVQQMDANAANWDAGIKLQLRSYSNVQYQSFNAGGSAQTQVQQFEEMINSNYDAIIVNVIDAAALAAVSKEAEKKGINVISINSPPQAVTSGSLTAGSYQSGALPAEHAAKLLNGANANCVTIGCPVALAAIVRGVDGFKDTIAKYPNMKFLENQPGDWTTEKANAIMRDYLTKYKNDIQVVWCQNDQMAIGAAQAIDAAGLTGKIMVYGCDGLKEAMEYIAEGKMTGSVYTDNVNTGSMAAMLALYNIATGIDGSKLDATPTILVPTIVLDKDNLSQYKR